MIAPPPAAREAVLDVAVGYLIAFYDPDHPTVSAPWSVTGCRRLSARRVGCEWRISVVAGRCDSPCLGERLLRASGSVIAKGERASVYPYDVLSRRAGLSLV